MKKLVIALVMIAVLMVAMFIVMPMSASAVANADAEYPAWSETNNTEGVAVDSIAAIKTAVEAGNKQLYMTANINVEAADFAGLTGFTLNGNGHSFIYDGDAAVFAGANDYTVKNLKLTGTLAADATAPFADATKVTLVNVVSEVDITTTSDRGGIIASVGGGSSFTDVVFNGTMTETNVGDNGSGGIVGYVTGGGTVTFTRCINYANISGKNPGGILGMSVLDGDYINKINMTDCKNYGNITKSGNNAGGIVGNSTSSSNSATKHNEYVFDGVENHGSVTNTSWSGGIIPVARPYDSITVKGGCLIGEGATITGNHSGGVIAVVQANATVAFEKGDAEWSVINKATIKTVEGQEQGYAQGGIIALIEGGKSVTVDYAKNEGDAYSYKTHAGLGGIIGNTKIAVTVTNCHNSGDMISACTKANTQAVAGILARAESGAGGTRIENCTNVGELSGNFCIGGIGGYLSSSTASLIKNCVNGVEGDPTVSAIAPAKGGYIGGIAGAAPAVNFELCTNYANVTGSGTSDIGGIVGQFTSAGVHILGCKNYGDVTESGTTAVGGITNDVSKNITIGAYDDGEGNVTYTENHGNISGNGVVGGIVAKITGAGAKIENSYNTGNVTTASTHTDKDAGGIVGYVNVNIEITNCHNTGTITSKRVMGGIAGWIASGSISTITGCTNGDPSDSTVAAIIVDKDVTYDTWVGGIAGYGAFTTFNECINYANVTMNKANNKVGGIVGCMNAKEGEKVGGIYGCANYGAVTGAGYAGGIITILPAGVNVGSYTDPETSEVIKTVNHGNVTAGGAAAGGIASNTNVGSVIDGVENHGAVVLNYSPSVAIDLTDNATDGEGNPTNTENDTKTHEYNGAAGIIAYMSGDITVKNATNYGTITINMKPTGTIKDNDDATEAVFYIYGYAGGILGRVSSGTVTVQNVTNAETGIVDYSIDTTGVVKSGTAPVIVAYTNNGGIVGGVCGGSVLNFTAVEGDAYTATNNAPVNSYGYAGGIVGAAGAITNIVDAINNGAVVADFDYDMTYTFEGETKVVKKTADNGAGGIVGCASGTVSIKDTVNKAIITISTAPTGTVTAPTDIASEHNLHVFAGGIVGYQTGGTTTFETVENQGQITYTRDDSGIVKAGGAKAGVYTIAGGIVGGTADGTTLAYTVADGKTYAATNLGTVIGYTWSGGIVGISLHAPGNALVVSNCYNNGDVDSDTANCAGGIVGRAYGDVNITSCVNDKDLSSTKALDIAGIIARNSDGKVTVTGCTNNGDISGGYRVGGIAGRIASAEITGSVNKGNISSTGNDSASGAGGMIGHSEANTATVVIDDCENHGTINATTQGAGGMVGYVQACSTSYEIKNSDNYGNVTGRNFAGGICGYGHAKLQIKVCTNNAAIKLTGAPTVDDSAVGGILGAVGALVEDCESSNGTVTVDTVTGKRAVYTGGIVGVISNTGTIQRCINNSDITIKNVTKFIGAGGILGNVGWGVKLIDDCDNYGDITVEATTTFANHDDWGNGIGGIAGKLNANSKITNSVNYGAIKELGASSDGDIGVGGVVGFFAAANLHIESCENRGEIQTTSYAGGILGHALNRNKQASNVITIKTCDNYNTVNGGKYAGGIIGFVQKTNFGTSHITEIASVVINGCSNSGGVTATNVNAGGIAADLNATNVDIDLCNNTGTITGEKSGTSNVGGIVGKLAVAATIDGCHNEGTINTVFTGGGIVGWTNSDSITLTNCTNGVQGDTTKGIINAGRKDAGDYVGGIVGALHKANASGCINYGPVNGLSGDRVGGITGELQTGGKVDNCVNYGAVSNPKGIAGGIVGNSQNITVTGAMNLGNVTGASHVGGIVGKVAGTLTAKHCINGDAANIDEVIIWNDSVDTSTGTIGGIAGTVSGVTKLEGCYNYAKIKNPMKSHEDGTAGSWYYGAKHVAGLVANSGGVAYVGYDIDNIEVAGDPCYNYGSISTPAFGHTSYVGGIMGYCAGGSKFIGSENHGDITLGNKGSNGHFHGAGGILGYVASSSSVVTTTIDNCTNYGNITSPEAPVVLWVAGGIVGGSWMYNFKDANNSNITTYVPENSTLEIQGCVNEGNIDAQYVGGIAGRIEDKLIIEGCVNKGEISSVMTKTKDADGFKGDYGIGGILGYAGLLKPSGTIAGFNYASVEITSTKNDGPVTCTGTHTGGVVGIAKGTLTMTDCENTAKGVITFTENAAAMTGVGGILGYAAGERLTTNISYCVNHADIVPGSSATGNKTYVGGIVGRAANPCYYTIDYCVNNGDLEASTISSSCAGGILGLNQSYGATAEYVSVISNCTNTGDLVAYYSGGFVGHSNLGGGSAGAVAYLTISNSTNTGRIYGSSIAAGFVANTTATYSIKVDEESQSTNTHMYYNISDCVNTGAITSANGKAAGAIGNMDNVEATVTDCVIAGSVSGRNAYILAPVSASYNNYTDTFTNCSCLTGMSGTNTTYVATAKSSDDIRALIRGTGTTTLVFDRANAQALLIWADKYTGEADITAAKQALEDIIGATGRTYFTTKQYEIDAAYDTLYELMYPEDVDTTFTITIDDTIELKEVAGSLTLAFNNPTPKSKLYVTVTQDGVATGSNFALDGSMDNKLEFWLVQGDKIVKAGQNLFEFDWESENGNYTFGANIVDEEVLYPDVYTGTLTFTVTYEEVAAMAE